MREISYLAAGEVRMLGQLAVEPLKKNLICDFAHIHAGFIQDRKDAFMLLLHQVHNDLIVEVIDLLKHKQNDENLLKRFCQISAVTPGKSAPQRSSGPSFNHDKENN